MKNIHFLSRAIIVALSQPWPWKSMKRNINVIQTSEGILTFQPGRHLERSLYSSYRAGWCHQRWAHVVRDKSPPPRPPGWGGMWRAAAEARVEMWLRCQCCQHAASRWSCATGNRDLKMEGHPPLHGGPGELSGASAEEQRTDFEHHWRDLASLFGSLCLGWQFCSDMLTVEDPFHTRSFHRHRGFRFLPISLLNKCEGCWQRYVSTRQWQKQQRGKILPSDQFFFLALCYQWSLSSFWSKQEHFYGPRAKTFILIFMEIDLYGLNMFRIHH